MKTLADPKGKGVDLSARLALHLLGPPGLELNNTPVAADRRKTLALLAYLAVNRWQHHRDHISAMLWPDYDQSRAYTNLRHILWEVQQVIGEGWVAAGRDTIGLIADDHSLSQAGRTIWVDVARFKYLITQSRAQEDVSLRISLLSDAVKLYRNHFLTGFSLKDAPSFNEWTIAESDDLCHQFASVLTMLTDDHCSLGQAEIAIPYGRRLIALDPLNEASHRQLMHVYIQAGKSNAALKQYQICEQILRRELGVDPQTETRALYKQIRKGEIKLIQPIKQKGVSSSPHNLPFQISTFIGREKELDDIANLIANNRLVTLVGTGGIGKTRLSLKVGEGLLRDYANGIWFAELAPLSDPTRVPQTVASLFGLIEGSSESPNEKLIRFLRSKTVLLILDNCEHILDACTQLADTLLKNCLNLKIVTTSREPLGITGEALYHVPPLGLADLQQILEKLLDYESIQLFEERARLVQEHFSLTMENASSTVQICHRLDGIPLAIELAAARVNSFSTEEIATQLNESFNILTGGSRTALPRQQTLRASIEWSWNLLTDSEKILLRRLSIFAGGWTLDGAESVCTGNGIEPGRVLDVLTQLAAKSLVVVNQEEVRAGRHHLLEMIREYAREKLVQAGEEESIQDQHLRYFLKLTEQMEPELVGPRQREWFARTNDERNNLRAALEHAVRTDVEAGLYISGRLEHFWRSQDNREGTRWLAEFLQKPESKGYPHARAKALHTQGRILFNFEQYSEAQATTEESLALFRAVGDQYGEVDSLVSLGFIVTLGSIADPAQGSELVQQGLTLARSLGDIGRQAWALCVLGWDHRDFKRAFAYWEESITLYRQVGHWGRLAETLSELGFFLLMNGQIDASQKCLDESSLLFQQLNIKGRRNHLLSAYGQIALLRGEYEQARAYFQEDAAISNESGGRIEYLWALVRLGLAELRAGNIAEARQILTDTAQNFQRDGSRIGVVVSLEWMASLYIAVNKAEIAARLIAWADTTREVIGDSRPLLEQADVDRDIAAIVSSIGNPAYQKAYDKGRAMTLDEAVAYALPDLRE
jgi:predicted ATPase/DNA-binding SARP family transcriptional activator